MSQFFDQFRRTDNVPGFESGARMKALGQPVAEPRYLIDQSVFVLYAPLGTCAICRHDIGEGRGPEDGVCPHHRKAAYLEVLQNCRDNGWQLIHWREETLKNGVVQASVTWGRPVDKGKTKAGGGPRAVPEL